MKFYGRQRLAFAIKTSNIITTKTLPEMIINLPKPTE